MNRIKIRILTVSALCIALNVVGSNLALLLKLPIYLDSMGTLLAAAMFGPLAGMAVGGLTGLFVGVTTDLYSLFFLPIQLVLGLLAGLAFRRLSPSKLSHNWWLALVIALPGTLLSTLITVQFFGGITSSGSSLLVQLLLGTGLSKTAAVLLIQVGTDYLDRLVSLTVVGLAYRVIQRRLPDLSH
ncbi:ECF transporter S component [Loigolactobacillus bifermentans]|uniref:Integral membrane protein n=1 Tax=Loigolactobacillus bifermentans DSM 20003 TaxID=1423726 RepID=A0A0R1GKK2_9LACO|nr:ECF transporter S component [Loigolactobacillus bifermentans]KRK32979.1 integral membrane protein [Loigolactobacillus bifermentans DSM 20003]QGG61381.1 ECF transporter S component [Loigolactobacillus bifermentans]